MSIPGRLIDELAENGILLFTFKPPGGKIRMDQDYYEDFEDAILRKAEKTFKKKYGKSNDGWIPVPLPLKKPVTWFYATYIPGKDKGKFERIMNKHLPGRLVKRKVGSNINYGIRVK